MIGHKLIVVHFGRSKKEVPDPAPKKRNVARFGDNYEIVWGVVKVERYGPAEETAPALAQTVEEATAELYNNGWRLIQEVADPSGVILRRLFE